MSIVIGKGFWFLVTVGTVVGLEVDGFGRNGFGLLVVPLVVVKDSFVSIFDSIHGLFSRPSFGALPRVYGEVARVHVLLLL